MNKLTLVFFIVILPLLASFAMVMIIESLPMWAYIGLVVVGLSVKTYFDLCMQERIDSFNGRFYYKFTF